MPLLREEKVAEGLFESAGDDRWIVGVRVMIVGLEEVEDVGQQEQTTLGCRLTKKEHTQNGVELWKSK